MGQCQLLEFMMVLRGRHQPQSQISNLKVVDLYNVLLDYMCFEL